MDLTVQPTPIAPRSARALDPAQRLDVIARAVVRSDADKTLEDIGREHGVGRTFLFEGRRRAEEALTPRRPGLDPRESELRRLRGQVEELRVDNGRLARELAEANDRLSRSVEVTPARLVLTALMLLLCPVSTRQAHQVLVVAFGARFAPADNTLAGWLLRYGRLARKVMAQSAAALLFRSLAADEIYFHGTPILCAVEPRSLAIAALERAGDCTGDTWEIVLDEFPNLELVASDLGPGLLCAVDRSDAHSQADLFHLGWLFPKVEAKLDTRAQDALTWDTLFRGHVTDPHCPGRKPLKALAEAEADTARALDDLEAFLQAKELVHQAMTPWTTDHRLATPRSQLGLVKRAIGLLGTIKAPGSGAATLRSTLEKHKHRLVAFTRHLWNIEVHVRQDSPWRPKRVIAALAWHAGLADAITRARDTETRQRLAALLPRASRLRAEAFRHCRNASQVEAQLLDRLSHLERSSSLAETINSILRPLQAIKKHVNQPFLDLFALQHNTTPFERSDTRAGMSPFQMLGVHLEGDEDGFVGVILAAARREGLLK
jgi:transposase-like protein